MNVAKPRRETLFLTANQIDKAVRGLYAKALGAIGHPGTEKALDNLSRRRLVHEDVLPFDRAENARSKV